MKNIFNNIKFLWLILAAMSTSLAASCNDVSGTEFDDVSASVQVVDYQELRFYKLVQEDIDGVMTEYGTMVAYFDELVYTSTSSNERTVADGYSSRDGGGDWLDADTWDGHNAPTTYINDNTNIQINQYDTVYAVGLDLTFGNNTNINIRKGGVLVVESLTFDGFSNLNINADGWLIVLGGDLDGQGIHISNNGVIAVEGNIDLGHGNNNGDVYLCGDLDGRLTNHKEGSCTDIEADNKPLYDFIVSVKGSALPITILYSNVEIVSGGNAVKIEYGTATEINSLGVHIMHSIDNGETWDEVGFVESEGEGSKYTFIHDLTTPT